jgi:hypothetical protein
VVVLRAGQRIEQPLPLGHAGRRVGNLNFLQQSLDLRTTQAAVRISEHATRGFKMLRAERWSTCHEYRVSRSQ